MLSMKLIVNKFHDEFSHCFAKENHNENNEEHGVETKRMDYDGVICHSYGIKVRVLKVENVCESYTTWK
jgi:hypothetical protein